MQYVYPEEIDRKANTFFSIFILIMVYWTYILAAFTSSYQKNYDLQLNQNSNESINFEMNESQFGLSCEFCKMKKFERSSNCATCERCVVRRDHHCVWLGNCVGFNNTRYFLNFLVWFIVIYF